MRDYFSWVKNAVKTLQSPSVFMALLQKRRAFAFAIAAAFLVAIASAFVVVHGADVSTQKNDAVSSDNHSSTQATITATKQDVVEPVAGGDQVSNDNSSSSSAGAKTNVTVNNQKIDVPQNGSVSKTIQNSNGTTSVSVTSNTSGNTNSSSSTTTNLNVSSDSDTQTTKVDVNNSTQ